MLPVTQQNIIFKHEKEKISESFDTNRKKTMTNILFGQIIRNWEFLDKNGHRHVLSLMHDCVSGARACLLDYVELRNSCGTTNVINSFFGRTCIAFQLRETGEWGRLEIRKNGLFGFEYSCEVSNRRIAEITSIVNNNEHEFDVRIISKIEVYVSGEDSSLVTFYLLRVIRIRDGAVTEVYRRYREFFSLHEHCEGMLKGNHLCDSLPPIPDKRVFGRFDSEFVEERRIELEAYTRTLLRVPHVGGLDITRAFLGMVGDLREICTIVRNSDPGFLLARKDTENWQSGNAWYVTVSSLSYSSLPPEVNKGDIILSVAGQTIDAQSVREVQLMMVKARRPYLVHFLSPTKFSRPKREF